MSRIIILIMLFLVCCNDNHQINNLWHPDSLYIKNFRYNNIDIAEIKDSINSFQSFFDLTLFQMHLDSILKANLSSSRFNTIDDSIHKQMFALNQGNIFKYRILRTDSIGTKHIIVYFDDKYENNEYGLWIAISNNGQDWKKYYTGLARNNFYYFKPKSSIPLFLNDSIIQIEVTRIRKLKNGSHWFLPEYEVLNDYLKLIINLNTLSNDKDKDGLTDIIEAKLGTNPNNSDTDNDNINDSTDKNPLNKSINSKFSILLSFLLDNNENKKYYYLEFNDLAKNRTNCNLRDNNIYMLISEEDYVRQINPKTNTYVVLNRKEYQNYLKRNPEPLKITYFSLNKIDKKHQYVAYIDNTIYKIFELEKGWLIKFDGIITE